MMQQPRQLHHSLARTKRTLKINLVILYVLNIEYASSCKILKECKVFQDEFNSKLRCYQKEAKESVLRISNPMKIGAGIKKTAKVSQLKMLMIVKIESPMRPSLHEKRCTQRRC